MTDDKAAQSEETLLKKWLTTLIAELELASNEIERLDPVLIQYWISSGLWNTVRSLFREEQQMYATLGRRLREGDFEETFPRECTKIREADQDAFQAKQMTSLELGRERFDARCKCRQILRAHWTLLAAFHREESAFPDEVAHHVERIEAHLEEVGWLYEVFISYAHAESGVVVPFKNRVLELLEKEHIGFWTDERLIVGELFNNEIKKAITDRDIGLAFISPAFFESKYIQNLELPQMLAEREQEGMVVAPIQIVPDEEMPAKWRKHSSREEPCPNLEWLSKTHIAMETTNLRDADDDAREEMAVSVAAQLSKWFRRWSKAPEPF